MECEREDRYENYLVEVKEYFSDDEFEQICEVEHNAFPPIMQDPPEFIRQTFENKEGVHLVIRNEEGKIIGYISSLPHNDALDFLKEYDPDLHQDSSALYVESAAILPEKQHLGLYSQLFKRLVIEARKRGYKKITMHARCAVLSPIMKKYGARTIRTIQNWYDFGEPFDYVEYTIKQGQCYG